MAEAKTEKEDDFDLGVFMDALGLGGSEVPPVEISTGKMVVVKKATAAQLFLILDILKSVAIHLKMENFDDLQSAIATIQRPVDFLELMQASTDNILRLVSDLCNISHDALLTLEIDDLLLIMWIEWKVNEHFFTTRLLPMMQKLDIGQESESLTESLPGEEAGSAKEQSSPKA